MVEYSVQCELQYGDTNMVTYLPCRHKGKDIHVGMILTLEGDEHAVWEITEMFGVRPTSEVKERERDWKNTRKASDI